MKDGQSSASKGSIVCLVINDLVTDQRMQRICSTLSEAGYDVTLLGRKLPDSPVLNEQPFRQVRLKCLFHDGFAFYAEYNIRLFVWLMMNWFTIVNAVDLDTIMPAWLAARIKGCKVTYDAHEWFPECPEIVHRPMVHRFWTWVERTFIVRVDAVYTVSKSIAAVFRERYGVDAGLVRNMPIRSKSAFGKNQGYILYQGALNMGRGLEQMIRALPRLNRKFWLAGEGDISQRLRDLVERLGLQDKVRFLGRLSPEALQEVTSGAWLGINILENRGMNYYYSLANKFFDYVQAGIPQLSMDFPEYQSMNREHKVAILLPNLEEETMVAAVKRLEEDAGLYNQLREHCREAAQHWTWDKERQSLLRIYGQLEG